MTLGSVAPCVYRDPGIDGGWAFEPRTTNPLPSGLNGKKPMPSSLHRGRGHALRARPLSVRFEPGWDTYGASDSGSSRAPSPHCQPDPEEIDHLVEIRTWEQACYEFAHFSDEELADGIMAVHTTVNGLTRDELITSLAYSRGRGKDIKEVWSRWEYKVSKVKLVP